MHIWSPPTGTGFRVIAEPDGHVVLEDGELTLADPGSG
jgi:hypothetical protein